MNKRQSWLAILIALLLVAVAVWLGGGWLWQTFLALHGHARH